MLILTRKITEGFTIGEHIRVIILEIKGKQVRLGIEAPEGMTILRDEISPRLNHENPPPED